MAANLNDLPQMNSASAQYSSSSGLVGHSTIGVAAPWQGGAGNWVPPQPLVADADWIKTYMLGQAQVTPTITQPKLEKKQVADAKAAAPKLRIVRIILADTDENIPVERRLIHDSDEIMTDATDQELAHEVPMKELLEKHNAYRKTVRDKALKSKEVFLEPIRLRDLTMTIVTVAAF